MTFFTSDEHYGHENILKYCNRPFTSIEEMDAELIRHHNERVTNSDIVVHCGDFTFKHKPEEAQTYINKLNGGHIFIKGSHDRWLFGPDVHERWEKNFGDIYIVADHYPGRVWARSHYGSIQVFGHLHSGLSHTKLEPLPNQYDVGVDNNNFYPVSLDEIRKMFKK